MLLFPFFRAAALPFVLGSALLAPVCSWFKVYPFCLDADIAGDNSSGVLGAVQLRELGASVWDTVVSLPGDSIPTIMRRAVEKIVLHHVFAAVPLAWPSNHAVFTAGTGGHSHGDNMYLMLQKDQLLGISITCTQRGLEQGASTNTVACGAIRGSGVQAAGTDGLQTSQ